MELTLFSEILLLLAISVGLVAIFRRLKLAPILAYLVAGIIVGPSLFNFLSEAKEISFVGELGIVFLLFSLGLEFSFPRLIAMRQLVFGVGLVQVVVTLLIILLVCFVSGYNWQSALVVACALALSSTAIVIKQLTENGKLQSKRGQLAVSILLFQDLAVVPMLIVIPIIAGASQVNLASSLLMALLNGALVFVLLISVGKWLLPRLFNEIAQARSDELFVLTTILVALLTGAITHLFGLSMALGAFLAGMMLGESQYKHQLEADIRPFRDILMGLFFISVGMQLDIAILAQSLHWLILFVAIVLAIKLLIIQMIARCFKQSKADAWAAGIMLCQMGEFGFVIAALALEQGLISKHLASMLVGVGVISMAITPYLINHSSRFAQFLAKQTEEQEQDATESQTEQLQEHVVICGFGRVGQIVSRFLKLESIPYVALDVDPTRVQEAKAAYEPVHFGDSRKVEVLKAVGIEKAKLVIIAFDDLNKSLTVIDLVKKYAANAKILVRTGNDDNLEALIEAGADEVIPETLEGSLMLVSHVMLHSGVPVKRIFGRVRRERKNHYNGLHGFYRGDSYKQDEREVEYLHAVTLTDNAFAVGLHLNELDLPLRGVEVTALRRDGKEYYNPEPDMELQPQDVLIILGVPRRVERAERFLFEGA
ncbi:sodium/hydrogen exchanger [Catenovulum agarivorans DS-2]|uniref:Sodium/hydrogen exchanger n=1 Tax=Catenovulum agarivorans DS-2 TaxID=1328313 RepID=W7QJ69_9ALTE|nr:monovalent cation:proton antiporter family protein [Catenovulum agarivorans]EWH11931.1 sodium/hydrogen exchanger [Catenovulum agarivorans DS-2]